jgi:hypothetical protein
MSINIRNMISLWVLVAIVAFAGCVDVPTNGPTPPDYRSTVKYVHLGRGVDTISVLVASSDDSSHRSVQTNGNVTITKDTLLIFGSYLRLAVDFSQAFDALQMDGSSVVTSMLQGSTSPYLDAPSGSRKFAIRSTSPAVDSLFICDSMFTTKYDTVNAGGTNSSTSKRKGFRLVRIPIAGVRTAIIDTADAAVQYGSQSVGTMFLLADTTLRPVTRARDGVPVNYGVAMNFGRLRYRYISERRSFESAGKADTVQIRFINASRNAGGAVDFTRAGFTDQSGLAYFAVSAYRSFRVPADTTYVVRVLQGTTVLDSLSVPFRKGVSYTLALRDSATRAVARLYTDAH